MIRIAIGVFIFLGLPLGAVKADDYPEVLFSNSVMSGNYGHSLVAYSGFSWVENVKGRVPLADTLYFTPGNSLSLKYTSSIRGLWELSVYYPENKRFQPDPRQHELSFYAYATEGLEFDALPQVVLIQDDTCTAPVDLRKYLSDTVSYGQWFNIRIPLADLYKEDHWLPVSGIRFVQGQPTGVDIVNHLMIDQIEFAPKNPPMPELNFPAVLSKATTGGQHVTLEWQLPVDPGIRYAKIYRSVDGSEFTPVAIRPISALKYADFVPEKHRKYHYKVTWVDYRYNESPYSDAREAEVTPLEDDALLQSIQQAHINYFDRHIEFNSGMHRVAMGGEDATVDVGGTGYSLLAQTIAASHGWTTPRRYIRSVSTVVDFLGEIAEQHHGMFPAYLDGRTGKGVYEQDAPPSVSLASTAALTQGLLVVRQYLEAGSWERRHGVSRLIAKIDQLWERMEWSTFAQEENTILYDGWSPEMGFQPAMPLGGFGKDLLAYILALSSPHFALAPEAYTHGLGIRRETGDEPSGARSEGWELQENGRERIESPDDDLVSEPIAATPYRADTLLYGFYLEVGDLDRTLLDAYQPFLTFDPWNKRDTFANYGETLVRLTEAYKRRDNEMDAGSSSPDIWGTSQELWANDHLPTIVPAISVSSIAFVPEIGMRSLRRLYHNYGKQVFTEFGFRDWINIHEHKVAGTFDPFHQAAVAVMIENYRTGLIWELFMAHPGVARTTERFFRVERSTAQPSGDEVTGGRH